MTKNQQLWLFQVKTKAKYAIAVLLVFLAVTPYLVARLRLSEASAVHNRGLALYSEGRYRQAAQQFQQETRILPDFSGAYDCWGLAVEKQGNVSQAIILYRKALTLDPKSSYAHTNLALALAQQGHRQEGLAELQAAAQDGPDDGIAHRDLGTMYHRVGRQREAQQEWHKAAQNGDLVATNFLRKHKNE